MKTLFKIGFKDISDIDTTILYTSNFSVTSDCIEFINQNAEVITKNLKKEIDSIPPSILDEFNALELMRKSNLTKIDEILINVLNTLVSDKKVIVFIDVLTYLNNDLKSKVITKLKQQNKRIINYTTDPEEALFLDYVIVTDKEKVIMEGATELVLKEEKILKKLGFSLPFIVELSSGLKYYHLVDKIYFDNKRLVDHLWK